MTQIILVLCTLLGITAKSIAGPLVVGNGAGSEENQYVSLWTNRVEIFQMCLSTSVQCGMTDQEKSTLQKISKAAQTWGPFQFYAAKEFNKISMELIRPAKVPFVAYSKIGGKVVFNFTLMYEESLKFTYDRKLFVLAAIAADQAGVSSQQAGPVIEKLVSFWQQRWSKLDLRILSEPNLQIWVKQGQTLSLLLFDDQSVFDLAIPLKNSLRCPAGNLQQVKVTSPYWSQFQKNQTQLHATMTANVELECSQGEAVLLNVEIELQFQDRNQKWLFVSEALKFHVSSLN